MIRSSILANFRNTPGNDLESADLQRISEPFWQKDSSHTDQDNFGLGLSLVEKYAELIEAKTAYFLKNGKFVASLQVPDLSDMEDFEDAGVS
ncbi:MAG: ATP-binding protein [Verrucomicrobiales bacterium]|nr:ATP-binding protein [Verrucomicrobiales bacterium]